MKTERARLRKAGKKLVFTNGAFDLLHVGHVTYLEFARRQGDALCIGLNSDASVKRYKGDKRPVNPQDDRARVLAALECVDYVVIFDEDEPKELIGELLPDVLVKGSDWAHYVSGADIVEANGGKVVLAKMVEGRSTSKMIQRIIAAHDPASSSASGSVSESQSASASLPRCSDEPVAAFGHEKLDAYRVGQDFVTWSTQLISSSAAIGREYRSQLERAALSIVLNTAEGNGKRERAIRCRYFDDARGSANECAACLDALVASGALSLSAIAPGKRMLNRITSMLTRLIERFASGSVVREASEGYDEAETETEAD